MQVSALTSSCDASLPNAIELLAELGFTTIDVPPTAAEGEARRCLDRHGLTIGCVTLEREAPEAFDLATGDKEHRARSLAYYCDAIERAAQLDAAVAYLTPPQALDAQTRRLWTESLVALADHAGRKGVLLCIEHFPRRLVPTVESTLALLEEIGHDELLLLLDVGHCLISSEEPADAIRAAGPQLGYIHFDDNDGCEDLHWPLLSGRLTESQIEDSIVALREIGYQRPLCLELNPTADSAASLTQGKALLERLL